MATRNLTLVVVPGTGARSISVDTTMTVADLVCRENLHGRDIIVNGVGVSPQSWNTTTLEDAVEVFATGSVKGNVDRTVTLVVVPGTGARQTTVSSNMTVADFVCRENLHGRDIIVNGVGVSPTQWNTVTLNDAVEIFATGSVKGNLEKTAVLVVVPGTGARSVTFDSQATVADFVCQNNLHGRDIILDGVGVAPSEWNNRLLGDVREIFATGSVKGNINRTVTLVVVPGTGARQVQVDSQMTVADFVCRENLHGRDIIVNGVGLTPQAWNTFTLGEAVEIFATGSVKGNGSESFINVAYGDDAEECFNELVREAQYEYGHDPYNGTISTQSGYSVLKMQFNSRNEAECYADMNLDSVQKYHCEAVRFTENGKNGFVFFGWAAC
jgi:sulfur carrier protein ThiS